MQIPTKNQPSRGRQPCLWGQDLADADGLGWIARNWVTRLDPDESSVIGPVLKKAPVAGTAGGACVILEEKGSKGGRPDHKESGGEGKHGSDHKGHSAQGATGFLRGPPGLES